MLKIRGSPSIALNTVFAHEGHIISKTGQTT